MDTYLIIAVDPDFDGSRKFEIEAASEAEARASFSENKPDAIIRQVIRLG